MSSACIAKRVTITSHAAWNRCLSDYRISQYCHLNSLRNRRYDHPNRAALRYSTNCDAEQDETTLVDLKSKALREKLIFSDYLDSDKVMAGYMKRFITRKRLENDNKKIRQDKLMNEPVYSVLLNEKVDGNDSQWPEDTSGTARRPVHMPYSRKDEYSSVDTVVNSEEPNDNETWLNEKYQELYEKYLEAKSLAENKDETLSLEEYLKEKSPQSLKTDLSNVPKSWMFDYEEYDDSKQLQDNTWHTNYGTADPHSSISSVPCGGCGALLHCKDHAIPGFLPSELFLQKSNKQLQVMLCQRCHFIKYYNAMLEVTVSADEYPRLLKVIKTKKCAVIMMVDLTDFPCSIWPDIKSVLHPCTSVFVVGNKVDLLPQDSDKFINHVKGCLRKAVEVTGIKDEYIRHVALISAKTGYGIEELINKLHKLWQYKGDVYVIGCTNVGKSTLFNALLQSDYCKVQAVDLIQRATTSPWPGTTLRLLKFPILKFTKWRLYKRMLRLKAEQLGKRIEEQNNNELFKLSNKLTYATLQGHIGRTFLPEDKVTDEEADPFSVKKYDRSWNNFGFDETKFEYKDSKWCYDTPGTVQSDQILDLLTTQELMLVLPRQIISPRTFILYPGQTIFLAGLGRLDYLQGQDFIRCTIFSSNKLPVNMTHTEHADKVYNELLETGLLAVPENDPSRLQQWPELKSAEMEVTGIGKNESIADVVLSSSGWIAIAGEIDIPIQLRVWSPQGRGLHLRTPALLPKSVALRGDRISNLPTYKRGRQAYKK